MPALPAGIRERGWGQFLTVLLSFLLVPITPLLRTLVPIEQTILLLIPALAVCVVLGWRSGARVGLAIVWIAIAAWLVSHPAAPTHDGYDRFARGWALVLSGAFGVFCVLGTPRTFLSRALLAVAVSFAIGGMALFTVNGGAQRAVAAMTQEIATRHAPFLEEWTKQRTSPAFAAFVQSPERRAAVMDALDAEFRFIPLAALAVFPALLALESLLALGLAWSLYHRMSRTRIGAPLAALRDFRFNDQLVWGLLAGAAAILLPTLTAFRGIGVNLLVFFGALYIARGAGVLVWFLSPGRTIAMVVTSVAIIILPALGAAFTFGLGLGDTWFDWRSRTRPTT